MVPISLKAEGGNYAPFLTDEIYEYFRQRGSLRDQLVMVEAEMGSWLLHRSGPFRGVAAPEELVSDISTATYSGQFAGYHVVTFTKYIIHVSTATFHPPKGPPVRCQHAAIVPVDVTVEFDNRGFCISVANRYQTAELHMLPTNWLWMCDA